jgi:hypothetical protein
VLLSGLCYFSLQFANPEAADEIISRLEGKIGELKKSGKLPPGLAEQYDIQLAILRDPNVPDIEILPTTGLVFGTSVTSIAPFSSSAPHDTPQTGDYDPGKNYTSMAFVLNHPFSRGSIVRLFRPTQFCLAADPTISMPKARIP